MGGSSYIRGRQRRQSRISGCCRSATMGGPPASPFRLRQRYTVKLRAYFHQIPIGLRTPQMNRAERKCISAPFPHLRVTAPSCEFPEMEGGSLTGEETGKSYSTFRWTEK